MPGLLSLAATEWARAGWALVQARLVAPKHAEGIHQGYLET